MTPAGIIAENIRHIAIIMDGNGRWAQSKGLSRSEGHQAGAKCAKTIIEESRSLNLKFLTLYAFSAENWKRSSEEVSALMGLFVYYLKSEIETLKKNGIKLTIIGDRSLLSEAVMTEVSEVEQSTSNNVDMHLMLAISYGGRQEILNATKSISDEVATGKIRLQDIDEELFKKKLYTADAPDPDLLIRTSDEHRISNFLLWQLAYSEMVFTKVLWPEFNKEEYHRCILEYAKRERRYGMA